MKAFIHHKKDGTVEIGNNNDPDFIVIMKKSADGCYVVMEAGNDKSYPIKYSISKASFVSAQSFEAIQKIVENDWLIIDPKAL